MFLLLICKKLIPPIIAYQIITDNNRWYRWNFFGSIFVIIISVNNLYGFQEEKCKEVSQKVCVDYRARVIGGHKVSKCWKYEQRYTCIGREQNYCTILEDNRGCNEIEAKCEDDTELGLCKNFSKKFVCNSKLAKQAYTKHLGNKDDINNLNDTNNIKLTSTDFNIIRDEKDLSHCTAEEINRDCSVAEEKCIEGASTRNINGMEVTKECWKWHRTYLCKSGSLIDECKELKVLEAAGKCREVAKECLYTRNNICEHLEVKYECSEFKNIKHDCISTKFCMGGVCDHNERTQNYDFGASISYLGILANLKSNELDGCKCPNGQKTYQASEIGKCQLFTGTASKCRKNTGEFNCCSEKGFLREVFKCAREEQDLALSNKNKLCHHVGSYRGRGLNYFKQKRSFCCFKSKIAKIIQVEGRKQLNIGWGDRKDPDCRGLTLDEIKTIDFSKIDFGEIIVDAKASALKAAVSANNKIKEKFKTYQEDLQNKNLDNKFNPSSTLNLENSLNPQDNADFIHKKIQKFYGGST